MKVRQPAETVRSPAKLLYFTITLERIREGGPLLLFFLNLNTNFLTFYFTLILPILIFHGISIVMIAIGIQRVRIVQYQ